MCTKVLAAVAAVLLMVSARAEGDTAQPPQSTSSAGAKAPEKERAETAKPERKPTKKQGKSGETQKPEAKGSGAQQEKAKQPCEEVKPCAIE